MAAESAQMPYCAPAFGSAATSATSFSKKDGNQRRSEQIYPRFRRLAVMRSLNYVTKVT